MNRHRDFTYLHFAKSIWLKVGISIFVLLFMASCSVGSSTFIKSRVYFPSGDTDLYGTLVLPMQTDEPVPVVVFVHGDGPLPFDAYGYYRPIWSELAKRGIGSFSWDKRGVGGSAGNWLHQSMDDRAADVLSAVEYLRSRQDVVDGDNIGLIGFSQAGWVMPQVSRHANGIDFAVFVSTAVNWQQQGEYYRKVAGREQQDNSLFAQALQESMTYDQYYEAFTQAENNEALPNGEILIDPDRYVFIEKNWRSDAVDAMSQVDVPVMAVFGQEDLNVDVADSIEHYQKIFADKDNNDFVLKLYPNATHGLLHSKLWNTQHPGIFHFLTLEVLGKEAFADNTLTDIGAWIQTQTQRE